MKEQMDKWDVFYKSGKIADYLSYKNTRNALDCEVENADNNSGRGDKRTPDR